jgi:hypothetical protein
MLSNTFSRTFDWVIVMSSPLHVHVICYACLQGLRGSELVVLILGERYGAVPPGSGLSATHEEYRDARGTKPVVAFVQEGVTPEAEQAGCCQSKRICWLGVADGVGRVHASSSQARQSVSILQLLAGGNPPGGDDVCAISAFVAECGRPAVRARDRRRVRI